MSELDQENEEIQKRHFDSVVTDWLEMRAEIQKRVDNPDFFSYDALAIVAAILVTRDSISLL